jgi:transposase-like protein
MPGGRPTDYDEQAMREAVESTIETGATVAQIAKACGVHAAQVYRWQDEHPEFRETIARARAVADAPAENALYKAVLKGDVNAAKWWLINRQRKEWTDSQKVELSGPDGAPIQTAQVTDEQLADIIARYLPALVTAEPCDPEPVDTAPADAQAGAVPDRP